jgi:serine/threonine protein kinase
MGSPFYMAPEQWSDEEPDARADIYSLGVILDQMLSGEVPFKGSSIPSIMKKHLTLQPPSFHSMGVAVPPAIEAVVRHALEKEVDARIDSIPNFLRELHAALNSSPVVATAMRETVAMDPNRTIASVTQPEIKKTTNLSDTAVQPPIAQETNFGTSFDSLAGNVSGAPADKQREERERREQLNRERLGHLFHFRAELGRQRAPPRPARPR